MWRAVRIRLTAPCNHLIALSGDTADGEIYAIAAHVVPDGKGGWAEDIRWVRYIDKYRRGDDGRWRFAKRIVTYDHRSLHPATPPGAGTDHASDASYQTLGHRLFMRGRA